MNLQSLFVLYMICFLALAKLGYDQHGVQYCAGILRLCFATLFIWAIIFLRAKNESK